MLPWLCMNMKKLIYSKPTSTRASIRHLQEWDTKTAQLFKLHPTISPNKSHPTISTIPHNPQITKTLIHKIPNRTQKFQEQQFESVTLTATTRWRRYEGPYLYCGRNSTSSSWRRRWWRAMKGELWWRLWRFGGLRKWKFKKKFGMKWEMSELSSPCFELIQQPSERYPPKHIGISKSERLRKWIFRNKTRRGIIVFPHF